MSNFYNIVKITHDRDELHEIALKLTFREFSLTAHEINKSSVRNVFLSNGNLFFLIGDKKHFGNEGMVNSSEKINLAGQADMISIGLIVIFTDEFDGNVNRSKRMTSKIDSGEAATAEDGFGDVGSVGEVHWGGVRGE
jgi:hypothetical protein